MEDKKESPAVIATSLPPCCYQQQGAYKDDEINLVDLWLVLVRRWQWVAAVMVVVVGVAVAYLLLATPVYEAEAVLLPPEDRHIQALNIPGINEITPETAKTVTEKIYQEFIGNLRSGGLRRQFFAEHNLLAALGGNNPVSEEEIFRRKFQQAMRVTEGTREQAGFVFVVLQGEKPELIAAWLNDFIQLAVSSTVAKHLEGIQARIVNEKETLQEQIRIDREFAKQRRMDRIAVLAEEIAIARELNIISRDDAPLRTLQGSNFGVAVSTSEEPLYLRGVKDLTAEQEALMSREADDPFIPGLRDKQTRLDRLDSGLRQLQSAGAEITPARLDQPALPPEHPVQPNKKLILALSLVLGGMLGIFSAFFAEFITRARRPQ
jgi:chain length determinant protein (polysaccharide antigen chain regulator)